MVRLVYFDGGSADLERHRLLIVIHHLVVDGVSWSILIEDLTTLLNGESLPLKTSSYRDWVETLQAATENGRFDAHLDRWLSQTNEHEAGITPLPVDNPAAPNTIAESTFLRHSLSATQTEHLLRTLP